MYISFLESSYTTYIYLSICPSKAYPYSGAYEGCCVFCTHTKQLADQTSLMAFSVDIETAGKN